MQTLIKPTRLAPFEKMSRSNLKSKLFNYFTDQQVQPNYEEYLSLNQALQTGDVPMDKVMDWVMTNPRQNRKLFETALYQGIDQLPQEIPELTEFFNLVEQAPSWFDASKLETAIEFTHRLGSNGTYILRDLALMTGYQYPGFNQPLIITGALNKYAGKRLAETHKWWLDVTQLNSFARFNAGFTSTIYVRFIHALVRHQLGKSERWDARTWGLPINQFDLAMTNIAFSGVVLLGIRALGILPNQQEVENFLHFWKYIGWLMGIDEKWLVDQESEGWRLLYWMQFAHPQSDDSSFALGQSLSKEPFERRYRYLRPLQQKIAYRQHLQVTQFFIGRKRMQKLGLEHGSAAWFAYYLMIRNLVLYTGAKFVPKLDQTLREKGRNIQKLGLALYQSESKQLASMHQ